MARRPGPEGGTSPDDVAQTGQAAHGWIGASENQQERKPNAAVVLPIRHTGAPGEESARKFNMLMTNLDSSLLGARASANARRVKRDTPLRADPHRLARVARAQ
jgi:hypothetical protein